VEGARRDGGRTGPLEHRGPLEPGSAQGHARPPPGDRPDRKRPAPARSDASLPAPISAPPPSPVRFPPRPGPGARNCSRRHAPRSFREARLPSCSRRTGRCPCGPAWSPGTPAFPIRPPRAAASAMDRAPRRRDPSRALPAPSREVPPRGRKAPARSGPSAPRRLRERSPTAGRPGAPSPRCASGRSAP